MLELLSLICGGVFRMLPSMLDLIHKKDDNAHALALIDKQIELAKSQSENKRQEIADQTAADVATLAAQTDAASEQAYAQSMVEALKGQNAPTGVAWVDALSASVRPVLTYWWCLLLYTSAKAIYVVVAFQSDADIDQFARILLTDFDHSVIGSILGFWFVDRALRKMGR